MIKKILFVIILLLVISYNLTLSYVDSHIQTKYDDSTYKQNHKIWSARGLYQNKSEQNSLTSIDRAFTKGAFGVEVDFSYDTQMDRFIVSHDHPKKDKNGKLIYTTKNGKLLTLEELFIKTGENHYFWLDYKNLDKLNTAQTKKAITRLKEITKIYSLENRVYIEGSNPLKLSFYTDAGFKTILGIHPLKENNILFSLVLNSYKIAYYFNNITALAMPYGKLENPIYGVKAQEILKDTPAFLFHVPDDEKLLLNLIKNDTIRVMLVGRDQSINRFYIHNEQK